MAQAVGGRGARTRHWSGSDVSIGAVVSQLTRLHASVARHEAGDHEHAHPRNCVMNLVVVARDADDKARAIEVADRISCHHPLRAVTILHEKAHGESRIDAEVETTAAQAVIGHAVQCENIRLDVLGPAGDHLYSLVEPLLVPDVHTYLWWMGSPPLSEPVFTESLEMAEVLVVDSSSFERPFVSVLELATVAAEYGELIGIADLQWGRLRPWRELIAQFFSPDGRRGFLGGVNGVGLDYAGEGRGNRTAAALLAGWLASTLSWRLKHAAAGTGGVVAAFYEAPREHPVEVDLRSLPDQSVREGEVCAVRIESVAGGRTCRLSVTRPADDAGQVVEEVELGEAPSLHQVLSMETPDEGDLMLRLLSAAGRDPVYLAALKEAADLLRALR